MSNFGRSIKKWDLKNGFCNLCGGVASKTPGQIVYWHQECRKKGRRLMMYPKFMREVVFDKVPLYKNRYFYLCLIAVIIGIFFIVSWF